MSQPIYKIYQSDLETAKNTSNMEWLDKTFTIASNEINNGNKVHIIKLHPDGCTELVAIIDYLDLLDYFRDKYVVA